MERARPYIMRQRKERRKKRKYKYTISIREMQILFALFLGKAQKKSMGRKNSGREPGVVLN